MAEEGVKTGLEPGKEARPRTLEEVQALKSQTADAIRKIDPVYDEIQGGINLKDTSQEHSARVVTASRLRGERAELRLVHNICRWFLGENELPVNPDPEAINELIKRRQSFIREAQEKDTREQSK